MIQGLSYISSSAENLYKFLFINGTILVILSMFYPLKQKNEIDIQAIDFNKNIELVNYEIKKQSKNIQVFKTKTDQIVFFLDSISKNRKENTADIIAKIKKEYNDGLDSISKIKQHIDKSVIELDSEKKKIIELKKQAKTYSRYSIFFLIVGVLFFTVGLIGWGNATKVLDKIKKQELQKILRENGGTN
jgi:hypothetical protein